MNNNVDFLVKVLLPLSFMAIWALTSLFNRESKGKPSTYSAPRPNPSGGGPRPEGTTLRWASPSSEIAAISEQARKRNLALNRDDREVIILSSSSMLPKDQPSNERGSTRSNKRPTKGKPVLPQRRAEPSSTRTKLAGVSQNVNQHLTSGTIELTPLSAAIATTTDQSPLGLASTPSQSPATVLPEIQSLFAIALQDPRKVREAFLLNEILSPPVSMRPRRVGPNPPR